MMTDVPVAVPDSAYDDGLAETRNVSLGDMSDVPDTVRLNGKDYELNRLVMRDFALAEDYLRRRRIDAGLAGMSADAGMTMQTSLRAAIAVHPVGMFDLWNEFDSRMMLIARSVVGPANGIPDGSALKWVMSNVGPADHEEVAKLLLKITGANVPLDSSREATSDPPDDSATETPSTPSSGTNT